MSRPSEYDPEVTALVCKQIAEGKSLRAICDAENMPDRASIYRWLDSNELFRNQYARARTEQAEYYASEIVEIADEHPTCTITLENGGIRESVDGAGVQRNRLRVDARKWIACKLLPKVYGEKLMHSGPDGEGPAVFVLERIGSKEADSSTK